MFERFQLSVFKAKDRIRDSFDCYEGIISVAKYLMALRVKIVPKVDKPIESLLCCVFVVTPGKTLLATNIGGEK